MTQKIQRLRDESTVEGKKIWEAVEKAAAQAPEWVVCRKSGESATASSTPAVRPREEKKS